MENYKKVPGEKLLYINPSSGVYFLRNQSKGDKLESLLTTRLRAATDLRDDFVFKQRHPEWVATPPAQPAKQVETEVPKTVGEILKFYKAGGFKTDEDEERTGTTLEDEVRNVEKLLLWWDQIPIADCCAATFLEYKKWRTDEKNRRSGLKTPGLRAVDRDLTTLANAFWYAAVKAHFKGLNPCNDKPKFAKNKHVHHCREFCPESADELHNAADWFFKEPRSVAMGFQLLLEAVTGLRCKEILQWGTENYGKLDQSGKYRFVWREKGQAAVNPYVLETPALKATMQALEKWRKKAHPDSMVWLPNEFGDQISDDALRRGLDRLATKLNPDTGKPYTPRRLKGHGAGRGFYVLVRRSWGVRDEEIAHELGQTSNGATIRSVYGGIPSTWRTKGPRLSWLPKNRKPAWTVIHYDRGQTKKASKSDTK